MKILGSTHELLEVTGDPIVLLPRSGLCRSHMRPIPIPGIHSELDTANLRFEPRENSENGILGRVGLNQQAPIEGRLTTKRSV
jgi:hypothetical protein